MEIRVKRMLWITLLVYSSSGLIAGRIQSQALYSTKDSENSNLYSMFVTALSDSASCRRLTLCQLVERFKAAIRDPFRFSSNPLEEYRDKEITNRQVRSYYGSYGALATPAYYPTFDPISVLASLAFLAFLLQSFASLFDRSRSIIPTIVSSRESSEFQVQDVAKRVLRALDEYGTTNKKSIVESGEVNNNIALE